MRLLRTLGMQMMKTTIGKCQKGAFLFNVLMDHVHYLGSTALSRNYFFSPNVMKFACRLKLIYFWKILLPFMSWTQVLFKCSFGFHFPWFKQFFFFFFSKSFDTIGRYLSLLKKICLHFFLWMWWVLLNLQLQRPHFVFLILYSGVVICRTQINIITSTVNSFYFS